MPDSTVSFRKGEKRAIYGSAEVTSGTLTIASATCTLYDSTEAIVTGWDTVSVSSQTSGAASTVEVGKLVDTADLDVGEYVLVFSINADASDGFARTYEPTVRVRVDDLLR